MFFLNLLLLLAATSAQENVFQAVYDAAVTSSCAPASDGSDLMPTLQSLSQCQSVQSFTSCKDILQQCGRLSSGNYQIQAPSGDTVTVYCDFEGERCGGTGGWMRVAYLDMSNAMHQCPVGLEENVVPETGQRICVYANQDDGCDAVNYTTSGFAFSEVCGRALGYQYGSANAFGPYRNSPGGRTVDQHYVDGLSITLGTAAPRTHIWSLPVGTFEAGDNRFNCPCNKDNRAYVPAYVGDDYYCESGQLSQPTIYKVYYDDPMWDGKDCGGLEYPCCANPNMPWFTKAFPSLTSQDIQVRFCMNDQGSEAITVYILELYIR